MKRRGGGARRVRFLVLRRDNYTCQYCGRKAPHVELEVDHRRAVADGGTDDPMNLVTACRDCNGGKGVLFEGPVELRHYNDEDGSGNPLVDVFCDPEFWGLTINDIPV